MKNLLETLPLLATALLASSALSHAATLTLGDTLTDYGQVDGQAPMILFNSNAAYDHGDGTITAGSIYSRTTNETHFAFVLLSPAGGNDYTVKDVADETTQGTIGVQNFSLNWDISSTDVLAYWGFGAAYSDSGTSSFYSSIGSAGNPAFAAPEPSLTDPPTTYTFYPAYDSPTTDGQTYVKLSTRTYAVQYDFVAASVPEPSTYAMMAAGLGVLALMRFRTGASRK